MLIRNVSVFYNSSKVRRSNRSTRLGSESRLYFIPYNAVSFCRFCLLCYTRLWQKNPIFLSRKILLFYMRIRNEVCAQIAHIAGRGRAEIIVAHLCWAANPRLYRVQGYRSRFDVSGTANMQISPGKTHVVHAPGDESDFWCDERILGRNSGGDKSNK